MPGDNCDEEKRREAIQHDDTEGDEEARREAHDAATRFPSALHKSRPGFIARDVYELHVV